MDGRIMKLYIDAVLSRTVFFVTANDSHIVPDHVSILEMSR
jgi:hypothetical protein